MICQQNPTYRPRAGKALLDAQKRLENDEEKRYIQDAYREIEQIEK